MNKYKEKGLFELARRANVRLEFLYKEQNFEKSRGNYYDESYYSVDDDGCNIDECYQEYSKLSK